MRMKLNTMYARLYSIMIFVGIVSTICFSKDMSLYLPLDLGPQQWLESTDNVCISGAASNSTMLFELIDGGAQQYVANKFKNALFKGYSSDSVHLCVEFYEVKSSFYAKNLFNDLKGGLETDYETIGFIGDRCRIAISGIQSIILECSFKHFFIRLMCTSKTELYKKKVIAFAKAVIKNIEKAH